MSRISVFLLTMLLSLPVAAGNAWLCLCNVPEAGGCCCHGDGEDPSDTPLLEKNCCCGMSQGSPHTTPPATSAELNGFSLQLPVMASGPVGSNAVSSENRVIPRHAGWDTGPPIQRELLKPVRLRP